MKIYKAKALKVLTLITLLALVVNMFFTIGLNAASGASGIVSGEYYFIKNKNSGLYLDVSGGYDKDEANVVQYSWHGGLNQQWKLELKSDGYYRISPRNSSTRVLDVYGALNADGANIQICTRNDGSNQSWEIIKNSDNSYRILSKVSSSKKAVVVQSASTSTGANVFQYTYTSGSPYNDDWILEKVKGMADIYSFNKTNNYYDINTSDCADDLSSDFDSMGYDGYSMLNSSASMAYTYLPLDTIWVFCGHGMRTGTSNGELGGGIWFGNSGGRIYAKGGSNSTLTKYINNSPSLSSERCIIYNACYSGLTHSTLGNLVDEAYNKGAKLVIGFTSTVGVRPGCYWNELFFEKSCDGGTVLESMSHADYWSDFLWNDPGGTEQRYVRGSTSQKLIY